MPAGEARAAERRLAVYGTLAPGRKNHWMLASLRGTWLSGIVRGHRVAAGWGNAEGFPALRLDPAGDEVAVDVFDSAELPDHWERLDEFEGHEYVRVVAEIAFADGVRLANIYVAR